MKEKKKAKIDDSRLDEEWDAILIKTKKIAEEKEKNGKLQPKPTQK